MDVSAKELFKAVGHNLLQNKWLFLSQGALLQLVLLLLGTVLVWEQVLGRKKSQLQYTPTMPALPLPCQTGLPGFSGERENWPKRMPRQERCRVVWKISLFSPSIFILSLVLSQNMDCGSNDFGIHFWRHDRSNVVVSIAAFISRIPNIVCL